MKLLLVLVFAVYFPVVGQSYPEWFVNQSKLDTESYAVGFANQGYYLDSTVSDALTNGLENFCLNRSSFVYFEQGFYGIDIGTIWLGKSSRIVYDTSECQNLKDSFRAVDTLFLIESIAVLISNRESDPNANLLKQVNIGDQPAWVNELPDDTHFNYAVGESKKYFYESSSWIKAQKAARINLAKLYSMDIQALEKRYDYYQESIFKESISEELENTEITGRWKNPVKGIYYVLIRAPN